MTYHRPDDSRERGGATFYVAAALRGAVSGAVRALIAWLLEH